MPHDAIPRLAFALLAASMASNALGQSNTCLIDESATGRTEAVLVSGDLVVADTQEGFAIYPRDDLASPLSTVVTGWPARGLQMHGGLLYTTYWGYQFGGFDVFDISDPANPTQVSSFRELGHGYRLAFEGDTAYVTMAHQPVWAVDVSDPTSPIPLGAYNAGGLKQGIAVSDGLAYIAKERLVILDVSDPTNLTLVGQVFGTNLQDLVLDGSTVYATEGFFGVRIFDVSDPALPVQISEVLFPDLITRRISLQENWLYVGLSGASVPYFDNPEAGVAVIDVTDPSSPVIVDHLSRATGVNALSVEGGDLFVGDTYVDSSRLALLGLAGCNVCPADLNGDGILDNGDIGTFVGLFLAGELAADFNGDGLLDNGDIGSFVTAFLAGCG